MTEASPQFKEEAWRGFAALDDPHTALLDLLEARTAPWRKGPSLEAWLVRELERWLQARPPLGPSQVSPSPGPIGHVPQTASPACVPS